MRKPSERGLAVILMLGAAAGTGFLAGGQHAVTPEGPRFGEAGPDFTLSNIEGKRVRLKDFLGKKNVALVFYPALFRAGGWILELRSLRSAAEELEKLDTVILGISFRPPEFNKDLCEKESIAFQLLSDEDRTVIKRYGVFNAQDNCAQRVSFLVDKEGMIRAIDREVKPATHGQDLVKLVKEWLRGKQLYQGACARCHGADGGDTQGYPNIKTLKGIGNSHSENEIIQLTIDTGVVNLDAWSAEDRLALAKFVRGL